MFMFNTLKMLVLGLGTWLGFGKELFVASNTVGKCPHVLLGLPPLPSRPDVKTSPYYGFVELLIWCAWNMQTLRSRVLQKHTMPALILPAELGTCTSVWRPRNKIHHLTNPSFHFQNVFVVVFVLFLSLYIKLKVAQLQLESHIDASVF